MADGPQSPLWLSGRLSHSWTRLCSLAWNLSDVSASPRTASAICTPDGEHHVSLTSEAKTALGWSSMS